MSELTPHEQLAALLGMHRAFLHDDGVSWTCQLCPEWRYVGDPFEATRVHQADVLLAQGWRPPSCRIETTSDGDETVSERGLTYWDPIIPIAGAGNGSDIVQFYESSGATAVRGTLANPIEIDGPFAWLAITETSTHLTYSEVQRLAGYMNRWLDRHRQEAHCMAEQFPVIDRDALGMADIAFIQSNAPTMAGRMRSAIFAYLYSIENRTEEGDFVRYPSRDQIADAEARHARS